MIDEKALEAAARAVAKWNDEEPDARWPLDGAFTFAEIYKGQVSVAVSAYLGALEGQVLVPVDTLLPFTVQCNPTLRAIDNRVSDFDPIQITVTKRQFLDLTKLTFAARPQNEGE